ncbi:FG-GAP-like repeat-containing protein [Streptomyces sp. ISL-86]|uniref:FG-GAP-like repeat-containing protein n=1 Tax=Streptomyces sp. ISL-86 TaxID=2819187 RepID=UPI001BE8E033|nr:FG-GAP-like repeat-containing protein [Streptomyces sp. ISL-86]MBT2457333.1 VCBS repeat-containing protein [Streptomyces sp. ISL-86]
MLATAALAIPLAVHFTRQDEGKSAEAKGPAKPVEMGDALSAAKRTGKDVEATAERSANTTTWAQPNGRFKLRVSSSTVRAKVGGEWKPIDTDLTRVEGGFAPKAINGRVVFSAGSKQAAGAGGGRASRGVTRAALTADVPTGGWTDLVRLSADGHDLTVKWPGSLPEPVIAGPRALYENIRPGIDLLMTAQDGGYSHLLVVKDKEAAADPLLGRLNYLLSSPDLSFHLDEASYSISARDDKGEEIAGAPTPFMWDSSGEIATTIGEPSPAPSPEAAEHPTLALPGLAGAEGAHAKSATASLSADGALTVVPNQELLHDAGTVYPVFIDPSFKGHKLNWTLLYKTEGSSSFYNGQNFNASGTNEARVGYETRTFGTSRSVFTFDFDDKLHGATISSAWLRALETHSWSCTASTFDVYDTPSISSSTTWNNSDNGSFWGNRISEASTAHGNSSSCPDAWVAVDVKKSAVAGAANGWSTLTLGLRARNEGTANSWKKFLANGEATPYVDIEFNRPPNEPLQTDMETFPGGTCNTGTPVPSIGKTDLTFQVRATDPDGNLKNVYLNIWSRTTGAGVYGEYLEPDSEGIVKVTLPWSSFAHNNQYAWTASAFDTDGATTPGGPPGDARCAFNIDHTAPSSPAIASDDFPVPGTDGAEWSTGRFPAPGSVRFLGNGTSAEEIREYQWSINRPTFDKKASPSQGDSATAQVTPETAGPNVIYARTVDKAGNVSVPVSYVFYVRPGDKLDTPGDVTGDAQPDLLSIISSGKLYTSPADKSGDIDAGMPAATDAGMPVPDDYWKDPATGASALISHSTDWFPGDGITDMIARMPDGRLYVYPGDGNGRFDVSRRMEILLPAGSPDPASFTQIVATEDVTGDGMADFFALADGGNTFWAFSGYSGASFSTAKQIGGTVWGKRDIVQVRDVSGDGVPDVVFRDDSMASRGLALRKGKPAPSGGVDLSSFASAAASNGGQDITYGTTGWSRSAMPFLRGTPDVTGDGIPDFWVTSTDGNLYLYAGGNATHGARSLIDGGGWHTIKAIG